METILDDLSEFRDHSSKLYLEIIKNTVELMRVKVNTGSDPQW